MTRIDRRLNCFTLNHDSFIILVFLKFSVLTEYKKDGSFPKLYFLCNFALQNVNPKKSLISPSVLTASARFTDDKFEPTDYFLYEKR